MTQEPRMGPRPLPLHLAAAQVTWRRSALAWRIWKGSSPSWSPPPSAALSLAPELEAVDPDAFAAALERAIAARSNEFLTAISAYRRHPYKRTLEDPPALWREGSSRLLDYGASASDRPPILLVPSLVNRGYILDLMPGRSFVRWLALEEAAGGFRPLLLDWGAPGTDERGFTLTDYIAGRLQAALDAVLAATGQRPLLLGYCMGGLLTLALAQQRPADLAGLALLATPWDFHAAPGQAAIGHNALLAWSPVMELLGELPVDAVQALFAVLDPLTALRKFRQFARLDPASPQAEAFVALEDWLNDGVGLAAPVARECLGGWYAQNATQKGRWRVAGQPVRPEKLELPSLCVIPATDRIVPPASARALAAALPRNEVQEPAAGHIGMMASCRAQREVWPPLARWMAAQAIAHKGALRGGSGRSKVTGNAALRRAKPEKDAGKKAGIRPRAASASRKQRRSDPT